MTIYLPEDRLLISRNQLLTPYGLDENFLNKTLSDLLSTSANYADLYFQSVRSESWSLEEEIVKAGSFSIDKGVGVRACKGDRTAFAYSDDISSESISRAVTAAKTISYYEKVTKAKKNKPTFLSKSAFKGYNLYGQQDPLTSIDDKEKVRLLERIERIARSLDPRIKQVMTSLAGEHEVILIARSDGLLTADIRPLVRLSITVIAEQNLRRETGTSGGGGRYDYHYFTESKITEYAKEAVNSALTNLEAQAAPAGNMTVVLGSGWPGVLLHEAVGHGLEGDFNRKGSSAFTNCIGQSVAAKGVTVVDNGSMPNRRGSLNIDDEGTPTQSTTLIENGILVGYLQDSLNARLMKMQTTGNARRESFASLPMPRMTNTYMLNGDKEPEEIIASVKKGLYAVNFGGGQVDITNGKFVFSASEAYLIENGKITAPVKGATLIGSGPESLKHITMIGNDLSLDKGIGVCGKEGQSVPVGVGQPTLKIENMTVGGTSSN